LRSRPVRGSVRGRGGDADRKRGGSRETLGYTMWWGSPAGMFVWTLLRVGGGFRGSRGWRSAPSRECRHSPRFAGCVAGRGRARAGGRIAGRSVRTTTGLSTPPLAQALRGGWTGAFPGRRTVMPGGPTSVTAPSAFKMAARFAMVASAGSGLLFHRGSTFRLGKLVRARSPPLRLCRLRPGTRGRRPPAREQWRWARLRFEDGERAATR